MEPIKYLAIKTKLVDERSLSMILAKSIRVGPVTDTPKP